LVILVGKLRFFINFFQMFSEHRRQPERILVRKHQPRVIRTRTAFVIDTADVYFLNVKSTVRSVQRRDALRNFDRVTARRARLFPRRTKTNRKRADFAKSLERQERKHIQNTVPRLSLEKELIVDYHVSEVFINTLLRRIDLGFRRLLPYCRLNP
jgi:hypothetical protein